MERIRNEEVRGERDKVRKDGEVDRGRQEREREMW